MKKMIKTLLILSLTYALPLIFAPELILNYKIIVVASACALMFLTQPDFKLIEASQNKASDKHTILIIILAGLLSQILPLIEWGYFGPGANGYSNTAFTIIGLSMLAGGLVFRIWSIRYLGRCFTGTVQIIEGHQIIKSGPYAIVRHPSYLGAYVAIIGSAIFLNVVVGTFTAAILMAFAYRFRINVEEKALIDEFGVDYLDYIKSIPKIIPVKLKQNPKSVSAFNEGG
jgi:protein-S-isoprenylcysteine O-methyltransferase Ste14